MAKIKGKGTTLKLDVATVFTTVAQLISVKPPGQKSLSYDSTTLDGGAGKTKDVTGYAESDGFEAEIFWDPELSVHAAILANITTPAESNWQVVFVNTGASVLDFVCSGLELSLAVDMNDGCKASIKGEVDGLPVLTI